jgi:hypothetical protein
MSVSHEPFLAFYALLPFILRKDLGASLVQISILSSLRPIIPIFAFYWSAHLTNQKRKLRSNLMGAWLLARLPFVFVFWIHDVWYLIFCCVMYELFIKSGIPALIEILKINMPKESRENTYTLLHMLTFVESILLGLFMAGVLDRFTSTWQIVCSLTAVLSLTSIFLQKQVPMAQEDTEEVPARISLKKRLTQPWRDAWSLLQSRPDFAKFQFGFMMGGFGLMMIAPSLSIFYVDSLKLSHSELIWGRSILMGIGVVISSSIWKKYLSVEHVSGMTQWILVGFACFPFILAFSQMSLAFFYISFIFYGIAQSGSHLLWNLSGTLFAKDEDSSPYSRVNILMLGLRGIVAPALGGFLCSWFGPVPVLILGGSICISGVIYMKYRTQQSVAFGKK